MNIICKKKTIFVIATIFLLSNMAFAERGIRLTSPNSDYSKNKRIALVIGNSRYTISPLKNPVNDAKEIEKSLK